MLKIAIVEDERECQEALIEHLRKYEKEKNEAFIVRIFNDGIDILDDYSADYDLIFLDIHMKSGWNDNRKENPRSGCGRTDRVHHGAGAVCNRGLQGKCAGFYFKTGCL